MKRPIIYDYTNYRLFLKDLFTFRKRQDSSFTHRAFASKAGFAAPNFLQLVCKAQRNLTADSLAKVAEGFDLNKGERQFFEHLVMMNQASSHEERDHHYRQMLSCNGFLKTGQLHKSQYAYYANWHIPALRELAVMFGGKRSAAELAGELTPAITPAQAAKGLALLQELGLLQQDADGRWQQTDRNLATEPETRSLAIATYHRAVNTMASEAIDRFPAEERDITSVTIGVSKTRMAEIKERIRAFRRELLHMADNDPHPDTVFQINFQAFPLSRSSSQEEVK